MSMNPNESEPPNFNKLCDQHQGEQDSLISQRCWEEKYRGDSRKWLMNDGTTPRTHAYVCSTMKETYGPPEFDERPRVGVRRSRYREKFYNEVVQEITQENSKTAPVEEYCTEYDGNFNYPDYDPEKEPELDTELFLKYPLYNSEAATYWKFQVDSYTRGQTSLPGFTTVIDMKKPFRRNSGFTKPISEVLDKDSLLDNTRTGEMKFVIAHDIIILLRYGKGKALIELKTEMIILPAGKLLSVELSTRFRNIKKKKREREEKIYEKDISDVFF